MILPFDAVGEGPPVVLLHAGVADRTMWREHLAPIADSGRRAIALDLPGFGEAGLEPGPQSPWEDVLQTLRILTSEPVALAGNSYGGAIALRVAAVAPSAVGALALISAPAPGAEDEPSDELAAIWEAEEAALEAGEVDRAVDVIVDGWTLPGASEEIRERIAAMQRRAFLLQQAVPDADVGSDPLEERLDRLGELRMPALCAAGTRDKPDFIAAATALAETLPEGRHATISRAGHLAPLEQPRVFRRMLLGFLDEAAPV
ncbi:MAG TPA: alpha/beta hydrolase [Solirubrobacteraceae bacterium]|jgi:pimeloyl-ACP methyl ester carboxylesterase|nr:alpha/beta hydrolase [Solirubrobacteraceae bacterium]